MKLYLDTSTPTTILKLDQIEYRWESGRTLARDLLAFIEEKLKEQDKTWTDITELSVYPGPGSFTGLRIGITVINTLAAYLGLPITTPDGKTHQIVVPDYGKPANITTPKK